MQATTIATAPGQLPPDLLSDRHLFGLAPLPPHDPITAVMQVVFGGNVPQLQVCAKATVDGTEFKAEKCVVRRIAMQPTYLELTAIVSAPNNEIYFVGALLQIIAFRPHLHLYEVARTQNLVAVEARQCATVQAIMLWQHANASYLSDRTSDTTFF